jgi:hypothetical protein
VRYLRLLSNSAFAGLLASAYLTVVLLHLNPEVPVVGEAVRSLLVVTAATYGVHIGVLAYALYVLRQITCVEPVPLGWISLRLLTWSAAVLAGAASVITWLHAGDLRSALPPAVLAGMRRAALALAAATAVFVFLAVARMATREQSRAVVAVLFAMAVVASVGAPLAVRARSVPVSPSAARQVSTRAASDGPRVVLVCLDGASLDVISPAVAAGRLPNFGRLLDRGASMHLATTHPTQPEPVWASAMTGKWPARHGIRSAARYRPLTGDVALDLLPDYLFSHALVHYGFLVEVPHRPSALRARPLWQIVGSHGIRAGVVGLPLTHPAEPVEGFLVSDRFHRRTESESVLDGEPVVYPARLEEAALEAAQAAVLEKTRRARMEQLPATGESGPSVEADRLHHALAVRLASAEPVRLLVVRYAGLDAVGHYYLRYAMPEVFGDVSDAERRQFGRVLEDYYAYVDMLIGELLAGLGEKDLLAVVSGFGMEPLTLGKRLLERLVGNPRFSGTHERAPDGFLVAYGTAVEPGRLARGSVVDVAPTLLYFLGLPVARDMDGFARTDLFRRAFTAERTITFIPSYD